MPVPEPDLRSEPQNPRRAARVRAAPAPPGDPFGRPAAPLGDASSLPSPRGRCRGGGERVVRLLDPLVRLPEQSRVIVVASEPS